MPIPAPFQEWDRLSEQYRALNDEQLIALRSKLNDFNNPAQEAIKKELRHRNLDQIPAEPRPSESSQDSANPEALFGGNPSELLRLGGVPVCDCITDEQLELCHAALAEAKIDSATSRPEGKLDRRFPQILVASEDLDRAKEVLSRPIPEEIRQQVELFRSVGDFPTIICPYCTTSDPLLESVDPTNNWLCESCEHRWSDPPLAP